MDSADLLVDAFERVRGVVGSVAGGLTTEQLCFRPSSRSNSIAWLIWHLTRIQDDHVAELAGDEQIWSTGGWYERFDVPFGAEATGYGQDASDVGALRADSTQLVGYHEAVAEHTVRYVRTLTDADLARIVDESWDPPVSLGTRLVSVLSDDAQHAGQAAYVRGLLQSDDRA